MSQAGRKEEGSRFGSPNDQGRAMHRRRQTHDRFSNHYQRVHEHSVREQVHRDPGECGCNGGGWILSSCDVWEQCPAHYDGQQHPESRTVPGGEDRPHELYVKRCREERIEDPQKAHEAALEEKARRKGQDSTEKEAAGGEVDRDGEAPPF
jgi:hypothetical protein